VGTVTGKTGSRARNAELTAELPPATSKTELDAAAGSQEPTSPKQTAAQTVAPKKTYDVGTVQPLDVTGVRTMAVGASLWLVALLLLLPFQDSLQDQGHGWWLWTCVAGLVIGLIGVEHCRRRRGRLAQEPDREVETSPLGAAGL
jgi:Protein of unknown function (DUF2530)